MRKENFEAHGGPETQARQLVPGRSWAAWARALGQLLPPLEVADLGCGEGYLTIEASRWATPRHRRRSLRDRAAPRAGARGAAAGARTSTWKRGELEQLPIRDDSVDVALLSQALHHADDPAAGARRSGAHPPSRRPRAGARSARARRSLGPRPARRPLARLQRRASWQRCSTDAGFDGRPGRGRRAARRRPVHGADCERHETGTGATPAQAAAKPRAAPPASNRTAALTEDTTHGYRSLPVFDTLRARWPRGSSSSTARWAR